MRLFVGFFCVLLTTPVAAFSQEPAQSALYLANGLPVHQATEEQVRRYMALVGLERSTHEGLDSVAKAMQSTSAPYLPASFWEDIRSEFLHLDITAIFLPIFQRNIAQEDMQKSLDFYGTDAGKRLLALQPLLAEQTKVAMRAKGAEIGQAVYLKHKDEIEAAKKRYEERQSPSPEIVIPK